MATIRIDNNGTGWGDYMEKKRKGLGLSLSPRKMTKKNNQLLNVLFSSPLWVYLSFYFI